MVAQGYRGERITRIGDIAKSILLLAAATGTGMLFQKINLPESNIIMAYIIGVLFISVATSRRIYGLISSVFSVLAFNYFFTVPYFTLKAYSDDYPVTFLTMFLTAFITSTLAVRMKQQTKDASEAAYRTHILLETNQLIQQQGERREMLRVVAGQLVKLLRRDIIFYMAEADGLSAPFIFLMITLLSMAPYIFPAEPEHETGNLEQKMLRHAEYSSKKERQAAEQAFCSGEPAGAGTEIMPQTRCRYLAIRSGDRVYGAVGIPIPGPEEEPEKFEYSITISILGECALALEKEEALRAREESALLAKNEQLRANLLRSISHDLRTPLTTISGNAGILLSNENSLDSGSRRQLYENIYDDSLWLINLVENLLSVTRIEDGTMQLHLSTELMDEVITEALQHINRRKTDHEIFVVPSEEFFLVKIDARLIMQVIINIVDNAMKYTPPGSRITISARRQENCVVVDIADNGRGLSDEAKARVFDRFFVAGEGVVDSRRSLGLGLSLCRSIIMAHGGTIEALDNQPHGALFRFTLPEEEVTLRE